MAANISSWPHGGSSMQSELRLTLLGSAGDDKSRVIHLILNSESPSGEKVGLCTLYKSEQAGRKISVVTAPGWDRLGLQKTENIHEELVRSVSLCPPGPHVLLLVIPVKALGEEPGELDWTLRLKEFLSERVWKHTIVLFDCDEGVEEVVINEHIHSTERILHKCGGRSFVLQKTKTQIQELFSKIDDLVEENHGDVFVPQTYHEPIQQKTKESSGETELRHRRGSLDKNPPSFNEDKGDSEEKKEAFQYKLSEDGSKIIIDFKQFLVMMMGIMGALLGSVTGAAYGVLFSFAGIFIGFFGGVFLAILSALIYAYIYLQIFPVQPTFLHRAS